MIIFKNNINTHKRFTFNALFDTSIKKAYRYVFGTGIITGLVPASGIAEKNGWEFFIYLCDKEITDFNKTQFEYSNRCEEYL